jgi:hypothetical protein
MSRPSKVPRVSPEIINSNPYVYDQKLCESCGFSIQQARSYVQYRRDWTGVRTPDFIHTPRKNLPQNSHTVTIQWDENGDSTDSRVYAFPPALKGTGVIAHGKCLDFWSWVQLPTATFNASARVKAISQLISRVGSSGGLAIDLGEYRQSVNMIATNCIRIAGAAKALKNGNVGLCLSKLGWTPRGKRGPQSPKETDPYKRLANHWLEYVYGWKPLIQDIHDSIEALETFLERNPWILTVEATGRAQDKANLRVPITVGSPGQPAGPSGAITPLHCGSESHFTISKCRFKIGYRRDAHVKKLIQDLGLNNPADLVWELLPWSFVIDWFLPVGPWLESLTAYDGLIFHHGVESHRTTEASVQAIGAGYIAGDSFGYSNVVQFGERSSTRFSYARLPLNGFPASSFPELKSPISTAHAANALALLVSVFKR